MVWSSAEKALKEFIAADLEVRGDIPQDAGQCSDFEGMMVRDRDVVLAALVSGKTQVAARLAGDLVSELAERPGQLRPGNVSWQFHCTGDRTGTGQAAMTSSRTK